MNGKEFSEKARKCLKVLDRGLAAVEKGTAEERGAWLDGIQKAVRGLGALARAKGAGGAGLISQLMGKLVEGIRSGAARADERSVGLLRHGKELTDALLMRAEGSRGDIEGYVADVERYLGRSERRREVGENPQRYIRERLTEEDLKAIEEAKVRGERVYEITCPPGEGIDTLDVLADLMGLGKALMIEEGRGGASPSTKYIVITSEDEKKVRALLPKASEVSHHGRRASIPSVREISREGEVGLTREEFLNVFLEDADEQLQIMNTSLLALEKDPGDKEALNSIFRSAHNIKGVSAGLGLEKISTLTHSMESVLDKMRRGEIPVRGDIVDVLFDSFDTLMELIEGLSKRRDGKIEISSLIERLEGLIRPPQGVESPEVNVELTEYERLVIEDARSQGRKVYDVRVSLDPKCKIKDARAYLIYNNLKGLGEVVKFIPPIEGGSVREEEYTNLVALVATNACEDEVLRRARVANVVNLSVRPFELVGPPQSVQTSQGVGRQSEIEMGRGECAPGEGVPQADESVKGAQFFEEEGVSIAPKVEEVARGTKVPKLSKLGHSIRVESERLDKLMNLVGELIISRARYDRIGKDLRREYGASPQVMDMISTTEQLGRLMGELQEDVMRVRMVPVGSVFERFPRIVRDLAKEMGKEVDLTIRGKETELDKTVIEEIGDPLMHLVRNAIDHGLESPEERGRSGKPRFGRILLDARHEGNYVLISVIDDGRGLDLEKIKEKAIERGIVPREEAEKMTDSEKKELIFLPGFSTSDSVTDVSGRGVGMDVVKRSVERLNGFVEIDSLPGKGSKFTLKIPLTLAIVKALLVSVGRDTFAIPITSVVETIRILPGDVDRIKGREVVNLRNSVLPLLRLRELFNITSGMSKGEGVHVDQREYIYVVVVSANGSRVGVVVDGLIGQQDIVIKPLDRELTNPKGIAGATILGDGSVALIVDVSSLCEMDIVGARHAVPVRAVVPIEEVSPLGKG
ncbi:MAG: chemotaxis protein CheW [bacterium]